MDAFLHKHIHRVRKEGMKEERQETYQVRPDKLELELLQDFRKEGLIRKPPDKGRGVLGVYSTDCLCVILG